MANGRNKNRKSDSGRDGGGFIALPWAVLDSMAYRHLSHPARSLLLEIARQYVRNNNGRLLLTRDYMATRGWKSADVIQRAKDELLASGLIHETVKGQRPNKASWYALTFYSLDRLPGYDAGAVETFMRGAYRENLPLKNAPLSPSDGTKSPAIAPSHGTEKRSPVPSGGTIKATFGCSSVPSDGHHLDMPSTGVQKGAQGRAASTDTHDDNKLENPTKTQGEPIGNPRVIHGGPIETLADLWAAVGCRSNWKGPKRPTAHTLPNSHLLAA